MTSHHDVAVRLRATLGGIAQEECGGDNLAILLASYFEPGIESEELDDSGTWKQGAIDACDKVLDAIHAHYIPLLESQAKAMSEAEAERDNEKEEATSYHGFWIEERDKRLAAEARLAEAMRVIERDMEALTEADTQIEYLHASGASAIARIDIALTAARAFTNAAKEKT